MNQRFLCEVAGIVDEELGRKIVHTIDDHIIGFNQLQCIMSGKAIFIGLHGDIGIQR